MVSSSVVQHIGHQIPETNLARSHRGNLHYLHFCLPVTAMWYVYGEAKQNILDTVPFASPDIKARYFIKKCHLDLERDRRSQERDRSWRTGVGELDVSTGEPWSQGTQFEEGLIKRKPKNSEKVILGLQAISLPGSDRF